MKNYSKEDEDLIRDKIIERLQKLKDEASETKANIDSEFVEQSTYWIEEMLEKMFEIQLQKTRKRCNTHQNMRIFIREHTPLKVRIKEEEEERFVSPFINKQAFNKVTDVIALSIFEKY